MALAAALDHERGVRATAVADPRRLDRALTERVPDESPLELVFDDGRRRHEAMLWTLERCENPAGRGGRGLKVARPDHRAGPPVKARRASPGDGRGYRGT